MQPKIMKEEKGDNWPVQAATFDDLDPVKIQDYIRRRQEKLGKKIEEPAERFLLNTGVLIEQAGKLVPTAGGLLLFGKDPQYFLWFSSVSLIRFKGKDVGDVIIDRKELRGTVPEMIEGAAQFLIKHMKVAGRIDGLTRTDMPEYPLVAVREAVINAIVHRDYSILEASIRIFMFDDRIEIYTPGGLPGPVTIENMEYTQYSRNKVIVEGILCLGDYMERLGTGIRRIKAVTKRSGSKEPKFVDTGIDFILTLFASTASPAGIVRVVKPQNAQNWPEKKMSIEIHSSHGHYGERQKRKPPNVTMLILAGAVTALTFFFVSAYRAQNDPSRQYRMASKFHSEQRYDKAIRQYKYFIQHFPESANVSDAQYYLATCFEATGMEAEALKEYQKLIDSYPKTDKTSYAQYWIATIYLKQKLLTKAIEAFGKVITNYPASPFMLDALHDMARCYQQQDKIREAIQAYQKALVLQKNASNGYEYYQIATCQIQLGDLEGAQENLNIAMSSPAADTEWIEKSEAKMKEVKKLLEEKEKKLILKKLEEEKPPVNIAEPKESQQKEIPEQKPQPSAAPKATLDEKEIYLMQANVFFKQKKYRQAIGVWKEVLALDIFNKEAKVGIDRAMLKLKEADKGGRGQP